jgi:NADH-quinone oxidoreductase subunit N
MTPMKSEFILLVPELFLLLLINFFLLYALFFSGLGQSNQIRSNLLETTGVLGNSQDNRPRVEFVRSGYLATPLQIVEPLSWLVVLSLLLSTVLLLNNPVCLDNAVILTNSFICDTYATFFKASVCLSSAAAIALAIPALKNTQVAARITNYEFLLVIYLAILGMLCLVSSYNLLTFYLSIELQSLSFYLLACSKSRSEFSAEAGLKYFILGAFSSAILLFGISLVYGSIGSIYFDDLAAILEFSQAKTTDLVQIVNQVPFDAADNALDLTSNIRLEFAPWAQLTSQDFYASQGPLLGVVIGLACICISLLFKLAAVPFHMWAPDVYEGSPMGITAFFAITAKIAALAALARFVIMTEQLLIPVLSLVTLATFFVGTLSAMRQVKIKRLLAFSGISNVGWFLMGLCSGRLDAVILHLIVYIFTSITLFSIFILPIHRLGGGDTGFENKTLKHISDLSQIYKTNTVIAFALTLAFFSLGGIPILAGFYSKYLIINASIQAEALGLLAVGLASAVLSAFYYLRVVKTVYFMEAADWFSFEVPSLCNAYLISLTSFFTAFFIAYPECISIWLIQISL